MNQLPPKRILLFVHYNQHAGLSGHVLYTLEQLHSLFEKIVFISNSPLPEEQQEKIRPYAGRIMLRDNTGFDFCAWKEGLLEEGWPTLQSYDSLTLMNDSCFGPLFDLAPHYQEMEQKASDFWGLTRHRACRPKIGKRRVRIPPHLQSYFIVFNRAVVASSAFQNFWEQVTPQPGIWDVILRYEIHLTGILSRAGFSSAAVFDSGQEFTVNPNAAHYYPDLLVRRGVPFIKVRSLFFSQQPHEIIDLARARSARLADLIEEHVSRQFRPDLSLRMVNKTLPVWSGCPAPNSTLRTAIHLDVRNPASLAPWLDALPDAMAGANHIDVYLTTPAENLCDDVKQRIEARACAHLVKHITPVPENHHSWIESASAMAAYDVVGYFRIDRTVSPDQPGRIVQHQVLAPCLLGGMAVIRTFMEQHPEVGIVIGDEPSCAGWPERPQDCPNAIEQVSRWLKQMRIDREITLDVNDALLTPYASCFWYRPRALEPLVALFNDPAWRQSGRILADTELALAILPVYSTWATGHDYRIAALPHRLQTQYYTGMIRHEGQRLLREYITSTYPWKMVRSLEPLVHMTKTLLGCLPMSARHGSKKSAPKASAQRE